MHSSTPQRVSLTRRAARPTLLATALGCLAVACDFDAPAATPLEYSLSQKSIDRMTEAELPEKDIRALEGQILGALEMLFGTPSDPRFLLTEDMVDEEFDPNYGGSAELDDDNWDALIADNDRRFKFQFQVLERASARASELAPELTAAREAYAPTAAQLEEKEAAVASATTDVGRAKGALEVAEKTRKKLVVPSMKPEASVEKLKAVIAGKGSADIGDDDPQVRLDALQANIETIKGLEKEISSLSGDIENLQGEIVTITGEGAEQKATVERLEAEISALYREVPEPAWGEDLWEEYNEFHLPALIEDPTGIWEDDIDNHSATVDLFASWYPTMGESSELYRQHCHHCHGTNGGGDGPTSEFLEPRPRDYREGKFKWVAVEWNQSPRREDLHKILREGARGTAMPSFKRFSRAELEGLVDYVRLLSIRGQVEGFLVGDALDNDGVLPQEAIFEAYSSIWGRWQNADARFVAFDGEVPRADSVTPEMIEHGRQLFLGETAACATCHGPDGRGEGNSLYEDDGSGRMVRKLDEWGNPSAPRNFRQSIFRGGSRPIDLYRRIKNGISGTIMPAASPDLSDDDIWSIAYYVLSIAEKYDVARQLELKAAHAAEAEHDSEHEESGH